MKIALNNTSAVVTPLSGIVSSDNKLAANSQQTATTTTDTTNQPQLQIDKSISSLLAQLAKSLVTRNNILQQLPQDIITYVEQILQQTMPDEENLAKGLSSLLKAQKNSNEQLKTLSATLNFLSADSSAPVPRLPESLVTLLNKAAIMHSSEALSADTGKSDSTLLLKLAHQLLDGATHEQAANSVRSMWNNSVFSSNNKLNTAFQQLTKQLAIPLADRENSNDGISPSLIEASDTSAPALAKNTSPESAIRHSDSDIPSTKQQLSSPGSMTSQENDNSTPVLKPLVKEQQVLAQQQLASSVEDDGLADNKNFSGISQQVVDELTSENPATSQTSQKVLAYNEGKTAELDSTILKQVIQEFAQSILLTKQQQLTRSDIAVVQQLSDDIHAESLDEDLPNLKQFFTAIFEAMPAVVKQAAQKLPEIQQLWLLKQLDQMTQLTGLDVKTMQQSSKLLDQLGQSLNSSTNQHAESFEGHRSLTFTLPLYFGEQQQSYPAYFHIYHQNRKEDSIDSELDRETWLRVSLVTENAGAVDLIFRLFKDNQLNLRVGLDNHNAAQLFNGFIPEIRTAIESTPITVTDISINTIGEK
ncbi:hypothetical protein SPFL3102_01231 [Sporomusaceae bacterium FL31]|nr:hypothetical protein SPFL3101_00160 [Sporomusaceae bacterium FL31]GCE33424.1 hypothetical protein SPFL3102_01231 [Sporomusaceae bacterium]